MNNIDRRAFLASSGALGRPRLLKCRMGQLWDLAARSSPSCGLVGRGLPTLFINGSQYRGSRTIEDIDGVLSKLVK